MKPMIPEQTNDSKEVWERSFQEQIARQAYNTAPVEALVRHVAYYLRDRVPPEKVSTLRFLEMGCGAGPNLIWLSQKGIRVSGVDISTRALELCRANFQTAGLKDRLESLAEASVDHVPLPDQTFDGILESCVFQHLPKEAREKAFREVWRLLKPGGLFAGYMLSQEHSVFQRHRAQEDPCDAGTLNLDTGGSKLYLTNIGLSHFFSEKELHGHLQGFSLVDPCPAVYALPREEAQKRGYEQYLQGMWAVYAIK